MCALEVSSSPIPPYLLRHMFSLSLEILGSVRLLETPQAPVSLLSSAAHWDFTVRAAAP